VQFSVLDSLLYTTTRAVRKYCNLLFRVELFDYSAQP